MPNPIDVASASEVAILVQFSYEDPQTVNRYAAWDSDVVYEGETFQALPTMEVSLPKSDGTVKGHVAEIKMSEETPLNLMRGTFPPVEVLILEITPGDQSSAYVLWRGRIAKNNYNYNGNASVVRVEVAGPKKYTESTISLTLSPFCENTLGRSPCNYNREANKETRTISTIQGNKVTLSSALANSFPSHWKQGAVRYRGFEVTIHKLESATVLYTTKPVPAHWDAQEIDLLPGCDKTQTRCAELGQTANYTGIGGKVPNRDVRLTSQ